MVDNSINVNIRTFLDNIGTCVISKETSTQIKAKIYIGVSKLLYRDKEYITYKSLLLLISKASNNRDYIIVASAKNDYADDRLIDNYNSLDEIINLYSDKNLTKDNISYLKFVFLPYGYFGNRDQEKIKTLVKNKLKHSLSI